jgi:hypothetical protein
MSSMNLDFVMMSDNEDTVFVECGDGDANEREPSVEIIRQNSDDLDMSGERQDIVQVCKVEGRLGQKSVTAAMP